MPIYEYHCQDCGRDHEIIRKFSDKPLKICPSCGGKLKKKLSLSGFQLKGEGWFKDGYSSKKPDTSKASEGRSPSGGSGEAPGRPDGGPGGERLSPPAKKESPKESPKTATKEKT